MSKRKNELGTARARKAPDAYHAKLPRLTPEELEAELDVLDDLIDRQKLRRASRVDTRSKLGPGLMAAGLGSAAPILIGVIGWVIALSAKRDEVSAKHDKASVKHDAGLSSPAVVASAFEVAGVLLLIILLAAGALWVAVGAGVETASEKLDDLQAKRRAVLADKRRRDAEKDAPHEPTP